MKRIARMVLRLLPFLPYWAARLLIYAHSQVGTDESRHRFLKHIAVKANRAGRVKVVSSGQENLPAEPGYMLYPNHQGLYDSLAFFESDPHPFAPVMKRRWPTPSS